MLKKLFVTTALSSLLLINTHCSYAQNEPLQGILSASGNYSQEYMPDIAYIKFSIISEEKTSKKAGDENKILSNNVINKLNTLIDKKNGDSLKTTSYSIYPEYTYNQTSKKNEINSYIAKNEILLKTKQIKQVGTLIDEIVKNGANQIDNVDFDLSNQKDYCNEIMAQAAKNASNSAQYIAKTLNLKIDGIKNISTSCNTNQNQPVYRSLSFAKKSINNEQSTPIEADKIKIEGNANIDFFIH